MWHLWALRPQQKTRQARFLPSVGGDDHTHIHTHTHTQRPVWGTEEDNTLPWLPLRKPSQQLCVTESEEGVRKDPCQERTGAQRHEG